MKKLLLAFIISITATATLAKTSDGSIFLVKPSVNTSTLNVTNRDLTPLKLSKCEYLCNEQYRSCMLFGTNPWSYCDQQRTACIIGIDGCYGI